MPTEKHPFFGKYEVIEQVGEGGFGRVVKARHRILGREFAIKQLAPGVVSSEADYTRFTREAHSMAQLDHPNIVRVYDADVENGFPYIAMEYIEGEDVEKLVAAGGPLQIEEVVRLGREISSALAHMHEHGIVHRDVKSSNILRRETDGSFFLTDFGLALQEGTTRITMEMVGSREFMSPEQINGEAVPQTDQYGLGVVLFEALTGKKPFEAEGTHEASLMLLLQRILHEPPPRVSTLRAGVPEPLDEAVARCLMKQPDERYPDMRALESILRSASHASTPPAASDEAAEPPPVALPHGDGHDEAGPLLVVPAPPSNGSGPARVHAHPPPVVSPTERGARPGAPAREGPGRTGRRTVPPAAWALLVLAVAVVGYFVVANRGGDEQQQASASPGPAGDVASGEAVGTPDAAGDDVPEQEPTEEGPAEEDAAEEGPAEEGSAEDRASPPPDVPDAAAGEEPAATPETPPEREPAAEPPPPPSEPVTLSPEEARAVADSYLNAGAGGNSANIERMYADRVRYYGRGSVSRAAVMADKAYYFRQWPERSYERLSDVTVEQTPEGAKVRFDYTFEVEGDERGVRGEGWTELTFRRDGDALRIVGENGGVRRRDAF